MNVKRKKTRLYLGAGTNFFLGFDYPLLVCAVNLLGYLTGLELYTSFANMLVCTVAILSTSSALPLVPAVCTFLFQFSMQNSPESHVGSDYYDRPENVVLVALPLLAATVASLTVLGRQGVLKPESFKALPLKASLAGLTVAFLSGGALSGAWETENLLYGGMLALCYAVTFWLFCLIFRGECAERIETSLIATACGTALILFAETVHLYLTNDALFSDGAVVKDQVLYGWGMWTMAGQFLAVTIPLAFLGVMRGNRPILCFISATAALVGAVMTLSRNALVVATLAYGASLVSCAFVGKRRRAFRAIIPTLAVALTVLLAVFGKDIARLLSDYLDRGLSDNGRFRLWRHGIESFLEAPLFGKGIFGIQRTLPDGTPEGFSFYPRMMHSTPIQLLGSMGLFGLLAYAFYRYGTLLPFIKRPTLTKTMLGATLLVIILASLIDNFLFLPKHLLFYPAVLAAAFSIDKGEHKDQC